jgi:hypothetical protein
LLQTYKNYYYSRYEKEGEIMNYRYMIFLLLCIFINTHQIYAQYKTPSFKQKIQRLNPNQLKALALAIALEGYQKALEMVKPLMNEGQVKLQGSINTIKIAIAPYEQDHYFMDAKKAALTSKFTYMIHNYANLIIAKKRAEPMLTDQEAGNKIFENALAELNNAYTKIINTLFEKTHGKNTMAWPSSIKTLDFNTLMGNWSSFTYQAQLLKGTA